MKAAYPTFIKQDGTDFLVYIPDWELYTEGSSFADAIVFVQKIKAVASLGHSFLCFR